MAFLLNKLRLINFKCFENHEVFFVENTVMIGQNNAGKTTVVEALRLLGLATSRLKTATTYIVRPELLNDILPLAVKGINVSVKQIDTDLEQVFFRYGEPPAIIEAFFTKSVIVRVYILDESSLFTTFYHKGAYVTGRKKVNDIGVPNVRVLPQIVPLIKEESFVGKETLQRNEFSKRTSRNFRNNLLVMKDDEKYLKLQDMIAKTWSSMRINDVSKNDDNSINLQMRDNDFATEIYYMGHGIQMWLQTLWFIVSSDSDAIIVLDEPDVYMHADLQRRLVRILLGNYCQMIIATHSVEIISEVQPENILIIDRKNNESLLADGYPILQTAIASMGSVHNLNLSRMLNNKKRLYIEGQEIGILRILYNKLFPKEVEPFDHIPWISTGGWGSWHIQKEHAKIFLSKIPDLKLYFLYDRDYHLCSDIELRIKEAKENNIRIHIWERKEIENYLILATAITRFICRRDKSLTYETVCSEVQDMIVDECEMQKEFVYGKILDEKMHRKKGVEASTILSEVRAELNEFLIEYENILKIVPGKTIISKLSNRCKEKYDVSFNAQQIASKLLKSEIDEEIAFFLAQIKDGK